MRACNLFLFGLVIALPAASQPRPVEPPALQLSLDEALAIASGENEGIAIAEAGALRAQGTTRVARSGLYPQLSGGLSYTRTLRSQFEDIQLPDSGSEEGALGDLPFGQLNQYAVGLTFSQLLFDGGATSAQARAARKLQEAAGLDITGARAQVLLDVVQAYFDAQLADLLVRIAEETLQANEQVLSVAQLAKEVGDRSEFELLRARVARDNQLPVVLERRTDRDETYLRLKQLLNAPLDTRLELTTGVEDLPVRFAAASDPAVEERAAVRQAALELEAGEQQVKASRSQRWPALSLVSRYAPVAYPSGGFPGLDDFREDFTVGLDLTIPLLNGGRIRGNQEIASANRDQARARLAQVQKAAALDDRLARNDLATAEAILAGNTATVEQSTRAYSIAQLRFKEGLSSQIELADARLLAEQARSNRARALRNVQVARARISLLRDLPLTSTPSVVTPIQLQTLQPAVAIPSGPANSLLPTGARP
jgi:outer membrane protein